MARLIEVDEIPQGKSFKLVPVEPNDTGKQVDKGIADIPRQLGLTGRHLIEGAADTVGIFSDPVAALINSVGGNASSAHDVGKYLADTIGFPSPQNSTERVVGDASRMLVGTGGMIKGADVAAKATKGVASKVLSSIASNPSLQASSSVGAGVGGGSMRETGGGAGAQFVGALAGGVAAPMALSGLTSAAKGAGNYLKSLVPNQSVDLKIDNVIKSAGIPLETLPASVKIQLREDVKNALNINGNLSPDALRRLADYRLVGATPRQGNLTLDPAHITQDKNLAKMGANSTDPVAQQLARIENQNDRTLITGLNNLGADTGVDQYAAGNTLISSLGAKNKAATGVINKLYESARDTQGRSATLDGSFFTNKANDLLDQSMVGGSLPEGVRTHLNRIATGEVPFTVNYAEQLKTAIAKLQRNSSDGSVRFALGQVRQALEETPLSQPMSGGLPMPGGQSMGELGQESISAFNQARDFTRKWKSVIDRVPALKAVVDENATPDTFVKDFIVGSGGNKNVMDLAKLKRVLSGDKDAIGIIKGQIALHLKNSATGNNADEVANFSAANYNTALRQIGDRKLNLFFTKDEVEMLKSIGRVAKYEKFQPTGSAVNNSNTASTLLMAFVDKIANSPLVRKIPFGSELLSNPAQNIALSVKAGKSINPSNSIVTPQAKQSLPPPLWPLLSGGLLTE